MIFSNKFILFFILLWALLPITSTAQNTSLIPQPQSIEWQDGEVKMQQYTLISDSSDELQKEIEYFKERFTLPVTSDSDAKKITFNLKPSVAHPEGYTLIVNEQGIHLIAAQPKGIFYGIQTILQLLPDSVYSEQPELDSVTVPYVYIQDQPRFPWRGMLLDCSRHFMEIEFVKRYIDLLAYHKMNKLHWHITEDQGWRLEIDQFPKLTEVGAWREDVSDEVEGPLYGGFYTKEDVREIVAYAQDRHIEVIPEIEMPGHAQGALAAYPEYSCTGGPFSVETEWGVFKEIYCAGNPDTYTFLFNILDEVMDLFPSRYIHVGADEVPKYRWEHCSKCQSCMHKNHLDDEHDLQSYFLQQINDYITERGKIMIGWDEIAEGGYPGEVIVQSWRGMEGAQDAIAHQLQTIVSPTSHAYFDYDLSSIDLEKVYAFNPIPPGTAEQDQHLVLGGECNMWSERAPQETVDSKVFPRLLAMSEVLWTYPKERNYNEFYDRVQNHYRRLDEMGVNYGFETVAVDFVSSENSKGQTILTLIPGTPDLRLQYSITNEADQLYVAPFVVDGDEHIVVKAEKLNTPYGEPFEMRYQEHLVRGKEYHLQSPFSEHYAGGGDTGLTNGWRGSTDFRDGHWQGFFGDDVIVIFDLGEDGAKIQSVSVGCLQYNNSWIFMPQTVEVSVSNDAKNYSLVGQQTPVIRPKERGRHLEDIAIQFDQQQVRYIKVVARNMGTCPDWHEATGSKAWLFVDEIRMK